MTTSDIPQPRVVLFQVKDSSSKLLSLARTAAHHFRRAEHLLILVEDEKTAEYVDELLWKSPPTSFLPHAILREPGSDLIAITTAKQNLNGAKYAFNLCPTPLLIEGPFKMIYDYEDLTSPNKQRLSALRFDSYKKNRFQIEAKSENF